MLQWHFARPPHIVSVAWLFVRWHTCLALYVDPSHFIIISQWQGPCLTCYYTGHLNKLKFSYSSSQWERSSLRLPIIRVFQKYKILGFPGGAVVKNPPANAGDTSSSPGLGRSHMPQSNWARKPQLLSLRVRSLCSATREAATVRGPRTAMKSGPRSPQLEKALAQKQRPNTSINK